MAEEKHLEPAPSTAAIFGHPIHPILVGFPLNFFIGAFVTDVVYAATRATLWARFSMWLLVDGVVLGSLAAIFGLVEFLTIGRVRAHYEGWVHFLGNALVLLIGYANLGLRVIDYQHLAVPLGITLSTITAVILSITAWFGGEMVYRLLIGISPRR